MEKLVNYSSDEEHEENWSKNAADRGGSRSHSPVHAPDDDYKRHKSSDYSRNIGSNSIRKPKQDDRSNKNKQQHSSTHYRDDYGSSSRSGGGKMSEKPRSKDYRNDRRERNEDHKKDYREDRRERNEDYRSRESRNGREIKETKDSKDAGRARRGSSGGGGDDDRKRSSDNRHQHHSATLGTVSSHSKYRDSRSGDFEKSRPSSEFTRSHRDSSHKYDDGNNDRNRSSFDRSDRSDRYRKKRSPSLEKSSSSSSHSKRFSATGTITRSEKKYRSRSNSRETSTSKTTTSHIDYVSPQHDGNNRDSNGGFRGRPLTTEAAVGLAAAKIAQELRKEMSLSPPPGDTSPRSSKLSPVGKLSRIDAVVALPLNHTTASKTSASLTPLMSVKTGFDNVATIVPSPQPNTVSLPSYYNPNVINPNKYAEQVQKRKLIWGAKKTEDASAKWGNAKFSQDSDGKVASKFMRLMGIKSATNANEIAVEASNSKSGPESSIGSNVTLPGASAGVSTSGDVKSREAMFSKMEQQYEVARQVTHTMRGVGLGFGSQARQF